MDPLLNYLNRLVTDRWAWQGVRMLLRASWFGLWIWCIGLGGHLLWDWPLRTDILGAISLMVLGLALLLLLRPRMKPHEAARRLDRRFHLDEQLATAVEIAATRPPPGSIGAYLLAQSHRTSGLLFRRITDQQRPPWTEAITLAALGLVALGLYLMADIGAPNLAIEQLPLPQLVAAQSPAQQFSEQPQMGEPGNSTDSTEQVAVPQQAETLEALADALRDQGATRPAAEALDQGDIAGAAQELRELADQAEQLSQQSRSDLAEALRDAAEQIEQRDPTLAEQLRQSADNLERGDRDAAQALEDLARAIEQLQAPSDSSTAGQPPEQGQPTSAGQSGQSGQGDQPGQAGTPGTAGDAPAGEQRQTDRMERLGVDGRPLQLDTQGEGSIPAEPSEHPPSSAQVGNGFTRNDGGDGGRVDIGPDPLRVPMDERDVVQEYFTP